MEWARALEAERTARAEVGKPGSLKDVRVQDAGWQEGGAKS